MVLPQAATAVAPNLGVDDGRLTLAGWSLYFLVSSGQTTTQTPMTHFSSLANSLRRVSPVSPCTQPITHLCLFLSSTSFLFSLLSLTADITVTVDVMTPSTRPSTKHKTSTSLKTKQRESNP